MCNFSKCMYLLLLTKRKLKMASGHIMDASLISYVRNNTGRMDIAFEGYVFSQKTNLKTEGNKCCLYRCKNKAHCSSSISLVTRKSMLTGFNVVLEPFEIYRSNVNHRESCRSVPKTWLEEKNRFHKIKTNVTFRFLLKFVFYINIFGFVKSFSF